MVLGELPDRSNVFLDFRRTERNASSLRWIVEDVRLHGVNCQKVLLYCPSTTMVGKLHLWLMGSLGENAWVDPATRTFENRIVAQFHSNVTEEMCEEVLYAFTHASNLRILVSTVAFEMGIDVKDVVVVVHWRLNQSISHYWQEVGRCARSNQSGVARLHFLRLKSEDPAWAGLLDDFIKNPSCFRFRILEQFVLDNVDNSTLDRLKCRSPCAKNCAICVCVLCMCCSFCKSQCPCVKHDTASTSSSDDWKQRDN